MKKSRAKSVRSWVKSLGPCELPSWLEAGTNPKKALEQADQESLMWVVNNVLGPVHAARREYCWCRHSAAQKKPHTVVRLRIFTWSDRRGVHVKRSLTYLRRHSSGDYHLLEEEVSGVGAEQAVSSIVNLDQRTDGVYEVITVNEHRDWESGHIDDYDLTLVPFQPEQPTKGD